MNKHAGALEAFRDRICRTLAGHPHSALTVNQLLAALELQGSERPLLEGELALMAKEGKLIKTGSARYGLPERLHCLTGTLQGHRRGFAFLRSEQPREEDVYIRSSKLNGAMHGDRVVVRLNGREGGRRREGEVVSVLQRGASRVVGTLERKGKHCYVVPDEERYGRFIRVPSRTLRRARPGEKVVVQVDRREGRESGLGGSVVENLGQAGTLSTEGEALRHRFDLPGEFPRAVDNELRSLPGEEAIEAVALEQGRRDLRSLFTVTIDGDQAKDFDDAITLEELQTGHLRLGVHIADVSEYVREGGPVDREAYQRGTSIYPVGSVIPMLPPLLSEGLCSLQAGRDRLAVSVCMDLSPEGDLAGYEFYPSLIRVDRRLTYRRVEEILLQQEEEGGELAEKELAARLRRMDRLAGALRRRRLRRGALDLDLPEAEISLDETGSPVAIERRHLGRSESLIEEFMILCNEVVASHFHRAEVPFLYRVHSAPTAEKMVALRDTLSVLGYTLAGDPERVKPRQLQKLLDSSKGAPEEKLVRFLLLRSLPQARYSAVNEGHFGLASRIYTHFTSPIRRYPDLVIHRILKERQAAGELKPERVRALQSRLPAVALHSSERERAAMEAERASEASMKARYMESRLGEEYPGIISGLTNFGIFVELENTVEGMIPLNDLEDDYYVYQEKQAALVGERTRRTFRLGDRLRVRVIRANRNDGRVAFALVE